MMEHSSAVTSFATWLWDEDGCIDALDRAANAARDAGALQHLDTILWTEALVEATQGSMRSARHCDELVREVRRAMGYDGENVVNASVMALSGTPQSVVLMIADGARAMGFGGVSSSAHAALAVCDIANREYRKAYERLRPMVAERFVQVTATYYGDYVEAAQRSGHGAEAVRIAQELSAMARANEAPRCRGVAERSLGLVEATEQAEAHYLAAIDALSGTRAEVELARAHLVYGEWLRRRRRRGEACEHLQLAVGHFENAGADLFLPRTKGELEAAGGTAGKARESYSTNLTAQELSIARLAADSHTNVEIGAKLFISPNTVDYHLRKVFQKLGISSRRQLTDRLSRD
jgi:DNA-binding CsgD family transcriptional regulator